MVNVEFSVKYPSHDNSCKCRQGSNYSGLNLKTKVLVSALYIILYSYNITSKVTLSSSVYISIHVNHNPMMQLCCVQVVIFIHLLPLAMLLNNWVMFSAVRQWISNLICIWDVWSAIKKLEVLCVAPQVTLKNFFHALQTSWTTCVITQWCMLKHESI